MGENLEGSVHLVSQYLLFFLDVAILIFILNHFIVTIMVEVVVNFANFDLIVAY